MRKLLGLACLLGSHACGGTADAPVATVSVPEVDYSISVPAEDPNAPAPAGDPGDALSFKPGNDVLPSEIKNRTVLTGALSSVSEPARVVGSIVHIKGDAKSCSQPTQVAIVDVSASSILRADAKLTSKALADVWFNEIIEKQTSGSVGYLVFSASMSQDERAEVLIQDVALVSIDNFDTSVDTTKLRKLEATPLPAGACARYVVTRLITTVVGYKIYTKNEIKASVVATLNIGGRKFNSHSKIKNDLRVAIQLQPIGFTPANTMKQLSPTAPKAARVSR